MKSGGGLRNTLPQSRLRVQRTQGQNGPSVIKEHLTDQREMNEWEVGVEGMSDLRDPGKDFGCRSEQDGLQSWEVGRC